MQDSNSLYGSSSIQSLTYSDGFSVLDLSPFGDVNDDALRSVGATHPNLAMISRIDLSGCGDITGDGILSLVAPLVPEEGRTHTIKQAVKEQVSLFLNFEICRCQSIRI